MEGQLAQQALLLLADLFSSSAVSAHSDAASGTADMPKGADGMRAQRHGGPAALWPEAIDTHLQLVGPYWPPATAASSLLCMDPCCNSPGPDCHGLHQAQHSRSAACRKAHQHQEPASLSSTAASRH